MSIAIDFSTIPTNEPVPAGNYLVVVENVELRTTKDETKIDPDTGDVSKYLSWELVITEGPFAGRRLFTITSLLRKALWKLRTVLINIGAYDENLNLEIDEDTNQVLEPELVGLVCTAVVKMGTDNKGNPRSEVDTILSSDGEDLEKSMRKTRKSAPGGNGAAVEVNGEAPAAPVDRSARKMTLR